MKENVLKKIYDHIDRDEIISKLTIGISPKDINDWLSDKYSNIGDKSLLISIRALKQFKDEYLDVYKQMRNDMVSVSQQTDNTIQNMQQAVSSNGAYRSKLNEYIDKEIDIKNMVKNMILAIESRAVQVFDSIQNKPNSKVDYMLINWFNTLIMIIEKYDGLLNGSPDKIIQQNNINIQVLDQHVHVFQKVIKEVTSRLDYSTSLMFVDILNEELKKVRPASEEIIPTELRLTEAKKLETEVDRLNSAF